MKLCPQRLGSKCQWMKHETREGREREVVKGTIIGRWCYNFTNIHV
jgi:hypothetical protein